MDTSQQLFVDSAACRYGVHRVLNNVHIRCNPGEIVGLLGRNGCGKSTLLKMIFGNVKGDNLHLRIDGQLFTKGYRSGKVGYLGQVKWTPDDLTVKQLIRHLKVDPHTPLLTHELVQQYYSHKLIQLSGGHRKLIEGLCMIYAPHRYILLDEPFSNLSPYLIDDLIEHIHHAKAKKGFIVTDHYYQRIFDVSDRIVLLHNGCNYDIRTQDDLITHGYLHEGSLND